MLRNHPSFRPQKLRLTAALITVLIDICRLIDKMDDAVFIMIQIRSVYRPQGTVTFQESVKIHAAPLYQVKPNFSTSKRHAIIRMGIYCTA